MAKGKSGTPGLREALRVVNKLGKSFAAEADADYLVASSASAAGQRGLSRQLGRIERAADAAIATQNRSLRRNVTRARAGQRAVRADQAATVNRYGAAMGASAARQYGQAGATAAAGTAVARGQAAAGQSQGKIADVIQGIAREGAAAQSAAAEYSFGQAMQQRAIVDNQTLAALTGDLYKTALSYNMQWDMWKRQQDYARKQAEKAQNNQLKGLAETLPAELPGIGVDAWAAYDAAYQADPENISVKDMAVAYADKMGYTENSPQLMVFTSALQKMMGQEPQSINTETVMSSAVTSLYGGFDDFDKVSGALLGSIEAGTTMAFQSYYGPTGLGFTGATPDAGDTADLPGVMFMGKSGYVPTV